MKILLFAATMAYNTPEDKSDDFVRPVAIEPACEAPGRFETWEVLAIAFVSASLGIVAAQFIKTGDI